MLTISKPLSAGQARTYHEKEFVAAEQNYWRKGAEVDGEWHGKLAEKYGLAGAVGAQEFARLTEGQHPETGEQVTYDPSRLRGITAYREIEKEFSIGDRIQFTAPNKDLGVANRDMGIIQEIAPGSLTVKLLDSDKTVAFDPSEMRHFDHGYAVTSHSAQSLTADRVLVNIDSNTHPDLLNTRLAYVSVSRASHEAHVYTDDAAKLSESLSRDVTKASAVATPVPRINHEQHTIKERTPVNPFETALNTAEIDRQRRETLAQAIPPETAASFRWTGENGTVQSYQHSDTQKYVHIDAATGQFYDRDKQPISRDRALDHALPSGTSHGVAAGIGNGTQP